MESYNIIRILITIIAGMSIFLGYRLFHLVTERQGQLKIQGKETKVSLGDVGPGIFFAFFGTFVLTVILYSQPYKEQYTKSPNGDVTSSRGPASVISDSIVEEVPCTIDLYDLCVDSTYKKIYEEGISLLMSFEELCIEKWPNEDELSTALFKMKKQDLLSFFKKNKDNNEMQQLLENLNGYNSEPKNYYIFLKSYLLYFYLRHPCTTDAGWR